MMPTISNEVAPVPPPAYYRAQARFGPALHIDALTLVNMLHLPSECVCSIGSAMNGTASYHGSSMIRSSLNWYA